MFATEKVDLEQLLLAVAERDALAFRRLYDLTAPKLLGVIFRIVRSKPAAEEVLQDVFLRVWQNAGSYSPETAPARAWMNTIARNRAIDVLRQKGFATVSDANGDVDWYEKVAEDRDREMDMLNAATLRHCLGDLDPQARRCVLLAYYEGFSREELAQRFDRPVNTIKTWLHRSLALLRTCIDESAA